MGESPETPVRVSKVVNRTEVPAARRRSSDLLSAIRDQYRTKWESTTLGIRGQTSGIPRVGQCIVVNRPKQSRFPGEYPKRQSRSFVSGKSVT
jgi:hypothetical protein